MGHAKTLPASDHANGPSGLIECLNSLYTQVQADSTAPTNAFILYCLGGQKSLIKVDMGQSPANFWYYDLEGRAATKAVRNIINSFLSEKYPQYQSENFYHQFHDYYLLEQHERILASQENGRFPDHPGDEKTGKKRLQTAIESNAWAKITSPSSSVLMPSSISQVDTVGYAGNHMFTSAEKASTSKATLDAATKNSPNKLSKSS